jgi:hypothetical protein
VSDRAIARIEAALASMGAQLEPPRGWEARVFAAIAVKRRRPWWQFAVPALCVAAAAAIYLAWPRGAAPREPLQLAMTVESGGPTVRGTQAHIGDTVHVRASGGAAHHAIWIYREERELVMACADDAPCDFHLTSRGDYSVVALSSDTPLPTPRATLDTDVAAAVQAGAQYKIEAVMVK